jgi:NAD(P)-dependent dehydrogenase (short-subunit alcohol dehydrogenase family)
MSLPSKNSGRAAVVTGARSGLGRDIALGLVAKGFIVFGTAFSSAEVWDLTDASGGRSRTGLLRSVSYSGRSRRNECARASWSTGSSQSATTCGHM